MKKVGNITSSKHACDYSAFRFLPLPLWNLMLMMILLMLVCPSQAWTTTSHYFVIGRRRRCCCCWGRTLPSFSQPHGTSRQYYCNYHRALPSDYQEFGERAIRKAAAEYGLGNPEDLAIEWQRTRLVVTVPRNAYLSSAMENNEDEEQEDDIEEEDDEIKEKEVKVDGNMLDIKEEFGIDTAQKNDTGDEILKMLDINEENINDENLESEVSLPPQQHAPPLPPPPNKSAASSSTFAKVDICVLSQAIQKTLLEEDEEKANAILSQIEMEVTTPGVSNELQGEEMFRAFQGFEVICEHKRLNNNNKKKPPIQTTQGRLHQRNEQYTVLNIQGRMKKIPNDSILSVKLPPAKREKGDNYR